MLLLYKKLFKENKNKSRTSLPASFSSQLLEKYVSHIIFYELIKFYSLIVFSSRAIWKSRHRHLGISIGIDVGIGIDILRSLYFCLSKSDMKKTSMVKYFSSTLTDLPVSFRRCLEYLFCRKPVRACF